MYTTTRIVILGAGTGINRDRGADVGDNRRLRSRGTESAGRYGHARQDYPRSYQGSSFWKTTRFASPDRWCRRRLGSRSLKEDSRYDKGFGRRAR